jgi:hypothetical protein
VPCFAQTLAWPRVFAGTVAAVHPNRPVERPRHASRLRRRRRCGGTTRRPRRLHPSEMRGAASLRCSSALWPCSASPSVRHCGLSQARLGNRSGVSRSVSRLTEASSRWANCGLDFHGSARSSCSAAACFFASRNPSPTGSMCSPQSFVGRAVSRCSLVSTPASLARTVSHSWFYVRSAFGCGSTSSGNPCGTTRPTPTCVSLRSRSTSHSPTMRSPTTIS